MVLQHLKPEHVASLCIMVLLSQLELQPASIVGSLPVITAILLQPIEINFDDARIVSQNDRPAGVANSQPDPETMDDERKKCGSPA